MAEAKRLSDVLADISRLYATLKHTLDRDDLEALGKRLIDFRKIINDDILKVLDIVNPSLELSSDKLDKWETQPNQWRLDVLNRLDQKIILEDSVELADFFGNVSTAVIEAQKNLNKSSGDYVKELEKSNSRIPPTYFAIPNIKAEMKLGVSELTSHGINVILFKKEDTKKEYFESTVTFEVVAAPPLPADPSAPKIVNDESPLSDDDFPRVADLPLVGIGAALAADEPEPLGMELRDSEHPSENLVDELRLARAALFAATDRLLQAKTEVSAAPPKLQPAGKAASKAVTGKAKKSAGKKAATKGRVKKTAKKG